MSDDRLPALIDNAAARLAGARTSGELLEARAVGLAALHYAKITKAADDTKADCLRLVVRAESLFAAAVDAGQANGEIACGGGAPSEDRTVIGDLGISRQRLHEFRQFQEAGPARVEAVISEQLDAGQAPTRSGILNALAGFTGDNEWYTPSEWLDLAREAMGSIDCDPASNSYAQERVKAGTWFDGSPGKDGLVHAWTGNVWLNPPYARGLIEAFVAKLREERGHFRQAIVLVDNRTDTQWFHDAADLASAIAFTVGRIGFYSRAVERSSPANGSALFYIGEDAARFTAVFQAKCLVLFRRL